MIEFNVNLDDKSLMLVDRMLNFSNAWDEMMILNANTLAQSAKDHMKPMMHVRSHFTGDLENSLKETISYFGQGFQIDFTGNFYGLYVDEGNFPASQVIDAGNHGLKAFPVDKRFGSPFFTPTIHGMGSITSGVPTHYSEKTAEWLEQDEATKIALENMNYFLRQVVSGA